MDDVWFVAVAGIVGFFFGMIIGTSGSSKKELPVTLSAHGIEISGATVDDVEDMWRIVQDQEESDREEMRQNGTNPTVEVNIED